MQAPMWRSRLVDLVHYGRRTSFLSRGFVREQFALTASNSLSVSAPSALSHAISLSCSTSFAAEGTTARSRLSRPRPPVDELRKPAGPVTGVGIKGLHMRPFVAFDQHIQLTAVDEVIFRASRHQTQRPDRQEASGLQFTTDFGLRACTPLPVAVTSTTEGREPNA